MTDISLREFLDDGRLGPIHRDTHVKHVLTAFGSPLEQSISTDPLIWKYGSLQIHHDRKHILFLGLYFRDAPFVLPRPLRLVGWWPTVGTGMAEFLDAAQSQSIELVTYPDLTFDDQSAYKSAAGVNVLFSDRSHTFPAIDSMQMLI